MGRFTGTSTWALLFFFLAVLWTAGFPFLVPLLVEVGRSWVSADGWVSSTGVANLRATCWTLAATFWVISGLLFWIHRRLPQKPLPEVLALWFSDRPEEPDGAFPFSLLSRCLSLLVLLGIAYALLSPIDLFEREDGVFETLQFLLFLLAGLTLWREVRTEEKWKRRCLLAAGGLFVVLALEEISWGQRILGWETPESWSQLNEQGETNLHNLLNHAFLPLYLGAGLLLTGATLWAGILRILNSSHSFWAGVLPHPALLPATFLILSFNLYPLLGALFPWGEFQELVASAAALLYARDKVGARSQPVHSWLSRRRLLPAFSRRPKEEG